MTPGIEKVPMQELLSEEYIRNKVEEVRRIHCEAAEKYLSEGDPIREQIFRFYSDTNRLFNELSHVFLGMTKEQVEGWERSFRELFSTKEGFVDHIIEKDYSTAERRDPRFPVPPSQR